MPRRTPRGLQEEDRLTRQRALVGGPLLTRGDVRDTDLGDIDVCQRSRRLSVSGREGAASREGGLMQ